MVGANAQQTRTSTLMLRLAAALVMNDVYAFLAPSSKYALSSSVKPRLLLSTSAYRPRDSVSDTKPMRSLSSSRLNLDVTTPILLVRSEHFRGRGGGGQWVWGEQCDSWQAATIDGGPLARASKES